MAEFQLNRKFRLNFLLTLNLDVYVELKNYILWHALTFSETLIFFWVNFLISKTI